MTTMMIMMMGTLGTLFITIARNLMAQVIFLQNSNGNHTCRIHPKEQSSDGKLGNYVQ